MNLRKLGRVQDAKKVYELGIKEGTFEAEVRQVDEKLSKFNGFTSYFPDSRTKTISVQLTKGKLEKEQVFEGEMGFGSKTIKEGSRFFNLHQLWNIKTDGLKLSDLSENDLRGVLRQLY